MSASPGSFLADALPRDVSIIPGIGLWASLKRYLSFIYHVLCFEMSQQAQSVFKFDIYRVLIVSLISSILLILMIINHVGFMLDDWLFWNWKEERVETPLFIVGNARSGTTLIHRLISDCDKDVSFTSFRTWEILIGCSISIKCLVLLAYHLDQIWLSSTFYNIVHSLESILVGHITVHPIGLTLVEEDEWLMMHIMCSQLLMFFYPLAGEQLNKMVYFDYFTEQERSRENDTEQTVAPGLILPELVKREVMAYYYNCVQKHLYGRRFVHNILALVTKKQRQKHSKIFLSKNPPFTMRLSSLQRTFPNAKFVCMVRDPIESVPSMISYISLAWQTFASPVEKYPKAQALLDFCLAHYKYPNQYLKQQTEGRDDNLKSAYQNLLFQSYKQLRHDPCTSVLTLLQALYPSQSSSGRSLAIDDNVTSHANRGTQLQIVHDDDDDDDGGGGGNDDDDRCTDGRKEENDGDDVDGLALLSRTENGSDIDLESLAVDDYFGDIVPTSASSSATSEKKVMVVYANENKPGEDNETEGEGGGGGEGGEGGGGGEMDPRWGYLTVALQRQCESMKGYISHHQYSIQDTCGMSETELRSVLTDIYMEYNTALQ